ncbi:MAG: peroxiredoxin [Candidatus Dormibacteria bacterium]
MALLEVGAAAPDITARRRDGTEFTLSSLRGRWVLVYFYPKDDTPGCTAEACGLRDNLTELSEIGADVIGVSLDSWESHQRFADKHGLDFGLAADTDNSIRTAYGVGRMMGVLPLAQRVSFLIDPEGRVAHVWPKAGTAGHAEEVLAELRRRQAEPTSV